jgi:hypothetical protein
MLALSALVLLVAGPARAATLSTTSFVVSSSQDTWCNLTNLSSKPVTVTIDHVDIDGNVVNTSTIEIAPEASDSSGTDPSGLIRCRFTGNFWREKVRAAALVVDDGTTVLWVPAN